MSTLTIHRNELTAEEFCMLWKSVWDGCPSPEQVALALKNSAVCVSIRDGARTAAMARMIGDLGMCYYIKDVIVHPDYQGRGVGRMLMQELLAFIRENGVPGTDIAVELCAVPDKMPFYEKLGFFANEAQRLRQMYRIPE